MFDKFKKLGELKKMRDQAMQIKHALEQEKIEIVENGVKVIMRGDQQIEYVEIDGNSNPRIKDAINRATKKTQEIAAKKLQEMGGGLGGLLG